MKTVCIYHSIDLDGWMSAAIVKHWFNSKVEVPNKKDEPINTLDFIGYNYGQPIPDLSEYDEVIMCDISFPKDYMFGLREKLGNKFIWIDHHISAIKDNESWMNFKPGFCRPVNGLQDTKFAACELTWKHFFPDEIMPEIVRLLGRYDCFGHKGTEEETKVLEFQYGARNYITNYESAYRCLNRSLSNEIIRYDYVTHQTIEDVILDKGKHVYQYLCTEAKQTYKNGFEIEFVLKGHFDFNPSIWQRFKFICINKERFNPINFGIDYHKDGYDGCACFYLRPDGKWSFSLYNDNGLVDCSSIAKQFGGGGHAGASGMILDIKTMLEIINIK